MYMYLKQLSQPFQSVVPGPDSYAHHSSYGIITSTKY